MNPLKGLEVSCLQGGRALCLSLPNRKWAIACIVRRLREKRNWVPLLLQQRMSPLVNNKEGKIPAAHWPAYHLFPA